MLIAKGNHRSETQLIVFFPSFTIEEPQTGDNTNDTRAQTLTMYISSLTLRLNGLMLSLLCVCIRNEVNTKSAFTITLVRAQQIFAVYASD